MFGNLKKYVIATRPWSFIMTFISVSVGTLLAAEREPISWVWFVLSVFGIILFHAAANLFNDYYDSEYKIDQEDSPTTKYRSQPITSGLLTPRQVFMEAVCCFITTFAIGVAAGFFRTYHVFWIGTIGMLTSYFYTAGPIRLKYRALGELAAFVMWGPLMIEGAYAVQRQALSLKALYISIPFGLLVALVLYANNMRDIAYDSRHRIKTISILLGERRSFLLFIGLIALAYLFVLGMVVTGIMSLWGLLIFLSLPKAFSLVKEFKKKIPDGADALTAQFDTVFGALLILAIIFESRVIL